MNNDLKILKNEDNNFIVYDPLFKTKLTRKNIMPIINWLCSMNILNTVLADNKEHGLINFLRKEENKYTGFTLKQIYKVIYFNKYN